MSVHTGQIEIISALADYLLMEAYQQWYEERRSKPRFRQSIHIKTIDDIPRVPRSLRREAELTAAMLYADIATGWKIDPFLVLYHSGLSESDKENWAYLTVMEALGHGRGWLDDYEPLEWKDILDKEPRKLPTPGSRGLGILIESLEWRSR